MADVQSVNHLTDSFYTTPQFARQIMTYKEWQETAKATQCRILACGETYEITVKHKGGGMYEVTAGLTYWKNGKPAKKEVAKP